MSHSAEHHIEHAEHAAHAAHDTFNTRVTITIAIIAAVLAGVTIQGHKAHNMMIASKVQAVLLENSAANKWTQFQAYNIRYHYYKGLMEATTFLSLAPGAEEKHDKVAAAWKEKADEYKTAEMPLAKKEAEAFAAEAKVRSAESERWHHKAERLDLGDLGLQLGVVFASLAILTKRRFFWLTGIAAAVIGFTVAMTGQFGVFLGEHNHSEHNHAEHGKVEPKGH